MKAITASTPEPPRTCVRCNRPVGRISAHRARPYRLVLIEDQDDPKGVAPVCTHENSCRAIRLGRRSERRD